MQPKPKPKKPRRPMSGAEYDRYHTTLAEASRRTRRYLITTGNPMEPENRVDVATGGKVTSRQKFTLGESYGPPERGYKPKGPLPGGKPEGKYQPKGTLPGSKPEGKNKYKGYKKGTPSPSTYGKRP